MYKPPPTFQSIVTSSLSPQAQLISSSNVISELTAVEAKLSNAKEAPALLAPVITVPLASSSVGIDV